MKIEVEKMKKIGIVLAIIVLYGVFHSLMMSSIVIPEDAIRFRVIANSNSKDDQEIKAEVSKVLESEMTDSLRLASSKVEASLILQSAIPTFENLVASALKNANSSLEFQVNYGMNYFPEKIYNGVKYDAGEYESLVVTLGDGLGDNWWCVLFPPLCVMEAEETETEEVEYHFFLEEFFHHLFS